MGGGGEKRKAIFMGRSNLKEDNGFHKVADFGNDHCFSITEMRFASTRLELRNIIVFRASSSSSFFISPSQFLQIFICDL